MKKKREVEAKKKVLQEAEETVEGAPPPPKASPPPRKEKAAPSYMRATGASKHNAKKNSPSDVSSPKAVPPKSKRLSGERASGTPSKRPGSVGNNDAASSSSLRSPSEACPRAISQARRSTRSSSSSTSSSGGGVPSYMRSTGSSKVDVIEILVGSGT